MKPVIINFDCVDHDPIDQWIPIDPFDVDFWMNFTIGVDDSSQAGDNFLVRIVTPGNVRGKNSVKHSIVLIEYSWSKVVFEVNAILEKCQDDNWAGIVIKLSQYLHWEYEGM